MKYMNMNSIFACVIIWIYYITYHVLFYKKFLKRFFFVQFGTIDNIWIKELQSILRLIVFFHKYLQIIVSFSIGSKLKVLIDNEKQLKWKGFDFFFCNYCFYPFPILLYHFLQNCKCKYLHLFLIFFF